MAVKFKVRDHYQNDAAFMLKLADAIQRDTKITNVKRKEEVIRTLNALASQLIQLKDGTYAEKS